MMDRRAFCVVTSLLDAQATQGAVNKIQLSNKQDAQRQQLALMQQQHEEETRHIQENLRLQQEQLLHLQQKQAARMEHLQKEMAEQHTQQQQILSEAAASSTARDIELCSVACVDTRNLGCSAEV